VAWGRFPGGRWFSTHGGGQTSLPLTVSRASVPPFSLTQIGLGLLIHKQVGAERPAPDSPCFCQTGVAGRPVWVATANFNHNPGFLSRHISNRWFFDRPTAQHRAPRDLVLKPFHPKRPSWSTPNAVRVRGKRQLALLTLVCDVNLPPPSDRRAEINSKPNRECHPAIFPNRGSQTAPKSAISLLGAGLISFATRLCSKQKHASPTHAALTFPRWPLAPTVPSCYLAWKIGKCWPSHRFQALKFRLFQALSEMRKKNGISPDGFRGGPPPPPFFPAAHLIRLTTGNEQSNPKFPGDEGHNNACHGPAGTNLELNPLWAATREPRCDGSTTFE